MGDNVIHTIVGKWIAERNAARAWAALWKNAAKVERRYRLLFAEQLGKDKHEAAHWRGECRKLVELVLEPTARDNFEAVEHAAERILKELENR